MSRSLDEIVLPIESTQVEDLKSKVVSQLIATGSLPADATGNRVRLREKWSETLGRVLKDGELVVKVTRRAY